MLRMIKSFVTDKKKNREYVKCLCDVLLLPKCFVSVTLVLRDLFTAHEIICCTNMTAQRVTSDLIFSIILIKSCSNQKGKDGTRRAEKMHCNHSCDSTEVHFGNYFASTNVCTCRHKSAMDRQAYHKLHSRALHSSLDALSTMKFFRPSVANTL